MYTSQNICENMPELSDLKAERITEKNPRKLTIQPVIYNGNKNSSFLSTFLATSPKIIEAVTSIIVFNRWGTQDNLTTAPF